MHFWVFSFNRGEFLRNCIASIEHCAPHCPIHIFDDNSNDESTRRLLAELARRHEVHYPAAGGGQNKHGGLYANMQAAYELSASDDLVCFIQDDTQLVRTISGEEIAAMHRHFEHQPKAGFIQPAFMRGINKNSDAALTRYDDTTGFYLVDRFKSSAGAFYSDIFVARIKNLRTAGWQFSVKEPVNEQKARGLFSQMAYLRNPFVAWLPYVPAFRGKTQTLAMRWAHQRRQCGFYPLRYMTDAQAAEFKSRDIKRLPYAEDFLQTEHHRLPAPWIYYPLQGSRLLKQLDRIERRVRSLASR